MGEMPLSACAKPETQDNIPQFFAAKFPWAFFPIWPCVKWIYVYKVEKIGTRIKVDGIHQAIPSTPQTAFAFRVDANIFQLSTSMIYGGNSQ